MGQPTGRGPVRPWVALAGLLVVLAVLLTSAAAPAQAEPEGTAPAGSVLEVPAGECAWWEVWCWLGWADDEGGGGQPPAGTPTPATEDPCGPLGVWCWFGAPDPTASPTSTTASTVAVELIASVNVDGAASYLGGVPISIDGQDLTFPASVNLAVGSRVRVAAREVVGSGDGRCWQLNNFAVEAPAGQIEFVDNDGRSLRLEDGWASFELDVPAGLVRIVAAYGQIACPPDGRQGGAQGEVSTG
jgi:hypothetical protein